MHVGAGVGRKEFRRGVFRVWDVEVGREGFKLAEGLAHKKLNLIKGRRM